MFMQINVPCRCCHELITRICVCAQPQGSEAAGWEATRVLKTPTNTTKWEPLSLQQQRWIWNGRTMFSGILNAVFSQSLGSSKYTLHCSVLSHPLGGWGQATPQLLHFLLQKELEAKKPFLTIVCVSTKQLTPRSPVRQLEPLEPNEQHDIMRQ